MSKAGSAVREFRKSALNVIGIQAPDRGDQLIGVQQLIVSSLANREHWVVWDRQGGRNAACQPRFTSEVEFAGSRIIHLPFNKSHRAFRVNDSFVKGLLECASIEETKEALAQVPMFRGYAHDTHLEAFYQIFDNPETAERQMTEWAWFIEKLIARHIRGSLNWKRLGVLLDYYRVVATPTSDAWLNLNALEIAVHNVQASEQYALCLNTAMTDPCLSRQMDVLYGRISWYEAELRKNLP